MTQRVLEQLEARDAVPVERYEFAIEDGVDLHALQRARDLDVAVADDLAVAAVEGDLPSSMPATMRKPSYLSSKTHPGSSNGASVRVASMGCRRFGSVEVRDKGRSSLAEGDFSTSGAGGSDGKVVTEVSEYPYVYRWNRAGRKGALCKSPLAAPSTAPVSSLRTAS